MSNQEWLDQSKKVRSGEELPAEKLKNYFKEVLNLTGTIEVTQFPGGFSNLTYAVRVDDEEFVLRRPPIGANVKHGHDMGREYNILRRLKPVYPTVPEVMGFCEDLDVIGAPFYVMRRVRGVILRPKMPPEMRPDPSLMSNIANSLIENQAKLHKIDVRATGLIDIGRPEGYIKRQVEGWTERFAKAKTADVKNMDLVSNWLMKSQPAMIDTTLVHNDFKYDNFVLNPDDWTEILAVLDWEMATVGDPLMDLGTTLSYWVQADDPQIMQMLQLSPTTLPGNPSREELALKYADHSGYDVSNIVFYYAFGLYKLGVIIEQIYNRYDKGLTTDKRFAGLHEAMKICAKVAWQSIQKNQISGL